MSMLLLDIAQISPDWMLGAAAWGDAVHHVAIQFSDHVHVHLDDITLLAQQFDTDPFSDVRQTLANFYESGRLWALLAGMILGYLIRAFTSYG